MEDPRRAFFEVGSSSSHYLFEGSQLLSCIQSICSQRTSPSSLYLTPDLSCLGFYKGSFPVFRTIKPEVLECTRSSDLVQITVIAV